MVRRRYPLEVLQALRGAAVEAEARALAACTADRLRAEGLARAAQAAHTAALAERQAVAMQERARLEREAVAVVELAQGAQYALGAAGREVELERRWQGAAARTLAAEGEEAAARAALGQARAAEMALVRHRERWEEEQARAAERAEEESALDQWSARAGRGVGGGSG